MEAPKLENIEQVSDGWIKKYILTYRLPDGSPYVYESVSRKGLDAFRAHLEANGAGQTPKGSDAICVVAHTTDDALVLIREFRYPLNSWCIGFPAGLVEPGEDPAACADRELQEETGFRIVPGSTVRFLPQAGCSSTGLTDEAVQVVFVEAEKVAEARTEPGELIEVFELPCSDIRSFLDSNTTPMGTRAQLVLEMFARQKETL